MTQTECVHVFSFLDKLDSNDSTDILSFEEKDTLLSTSRAHPDIGGLVLTVQLSSGMVLGSSKNESLYNH